MFHAYVQLFEVPIKEDCWATQYWAQVNPLPINILLVPRVSRNNEWAHPLPTHVHSQMKESIYASLGWKKTIFILFVAVDGLTYSKFTFN
jgi:hypothetical protein